MKRAFLLCLMLCLCGLGCSPFSKDESELKPVPALFGTPYREAVGPRARVDLSGGQEEVAADGRGERAVAYESLTPVEDQGGRDGASPHMWNRLGAELKIGATEPIQVTAEAMPVYEFVNLVLGKVLQVSYAVDPQVQELRHTVTLNMTQPMAPREFLPFAVELLRQYGVELVVQQNRIRVSVLKDADPALSFAGLSVGRRLPPLPPQTRIVHYYPTNYVHPNDLYGMLVRIFRTVSDVVIQPVQQGLPMFSLTGELGQVARVVELIQVFDRPDLRGRELGLLYLDYIPVADFVAEIKKVLPALGVPVADKKGLGVSLLEVESLNAVILVSPYAEWAEKVVQWKEKLDSPEQLGDEQRFFLYQPQNRPATELQTVLQSLQGVGEEEGTGEDKVRAKPEPKSSVGGIGLTREFNVTVDERRNTLVIAAYPSDYKNILQLLRKLDTEPRQVLIEVTLAEVTLTGQLQYGVEWYFREQAKAGEHDRRFDHEFQTLSGLGLGGSGFNYAVTKINENFRAKLNAFSKDDLINIVSRPHVVVLDGQTATINVGNEVPVVISEVSADDLENSTAENSILRNVQYRNTGTILTVKPVVNSRGVVTLEVQQELSEAQTNSVSSIDSPLILKRSINTMLNLRSGETVLLGGMISRNKSKTQQKVPILGDVPLLGRAFRTDSDSSTRSELIVEITPYILNDTQELNAISEAFRRRVADGEEPLHVRRDSGPASPADMPARGGARSPEMEE